MNERIYGLIGRTLKHSYSVQIHRALGNDDYALYELEPESLGAFLSREEIGGLNVLAVRDYLKGVRTTKNGAEKLDTPPSDVLYFELEDGNWVCVRPSGTEPKIKLYVNTNDKDGAAAHALNEKLCAASEAMMK